MGLFRLIGRTRPRRSLVHAALAIALLAIVAYQLNSADGDAAARPQQVGQSVNP